MKPLPRLAWFALSILAPFGGCGKNRQVAYPSRRGEPLRVESSEGARPRAGQIDLQAPTPAASQAGDIDVPMFDLDDPDPR